MSTVSLPIDETVAERPGAARAAADLLAQAINGYSWLDPKEIKAKRCWLPTYDLEELFDKLVINVVPRGVTYTQVTRETNYRDATVEVGLLRKPDPEKYSTIESQEALADAHTSLVEAIAEYLLSPAGRLPCGPGGPVVRTAEVTTLLLLNHFEELKQLTSVIRVIVRDRA